MNAKIAAAAGAAALCLAGCISLLPKEKPAQLYRFGARPAAAPIGPAPVGSASVDPAAQGAAFAVRALSLTFDRATAGDRILTTIGDRTAYIAGARWVTSAATLFEAATTRAFDRHRGPARLLAPGEPSMADFTLKIDVRTFEVRYDHGPRAGGGAAPAVAVGVYAALVRRADPRDVRNRLFEAEAPAASNSIHAIVTAYDVAVAKVLTELVTWVDAKGAAQG